MTLLEQAAELGASDVHLLSGDLSPFDRGTYRSSIPPIYPGRGSFANTIERTQNWEAGPMPSIDRAFDVPGLGRLRVNLYRVSDWLAAAIRVLPQQAPTLAS